MGATAPVERDEQAVGETLSRVEPALARVLRRDGVCARRGERGETKEVRRGRCTRGERLGFHGKTQEEGAGGCGLWACGLGAAHSSRW